MQIKLYKTSTDKDHLTKIYTDELVINGTLREACDIVDPSLELEYSPEIIGKNYMYIEDFGRYYYLDPPVIDGKRVRLIGHCDVLHSHKAGILTSQALVLRSQQGDEYIKDNRATQTERISWTSRDLGPAFKPGNYYILIKGVTG